jgi:hypothetical protein
MPTTGLGKVHTDLPAVKFQLPVLGGIDRRLGVLHGLEGDEAEATADLGPPIDDERAGLEGAVGREDLLDVGLGGGGRQAEDSDDLGGRGCDTHIKGSSFTADSATAHALTGRLVPPVSRIHR